MFHRNLRPEELDLIHRVEMFVKETDRREGRDPSHVFEVIRLAVEIARRVPHAVHPLVLVLTVLFRELGNRLTGDTPVGGFVGAAVAESFLKVTGTSDLERMQIVRAVTMADPSGIMPSETIEEQIVTDAKRLDRMGMVGLVRDLTASWVATDEFLQERLHQLKSDYEKLFFEESRQIGEPLFNQTRILAESLSKAYRLRAQSIDQIVLPQA
jgi:HD superfamily phosphodiesterase